jgi:acetolactate synthase-1/3 small subunit
MGVDGSIGGPGSAPRHHILSVLVENKAGVLARVASLFSRRGFNIFSLAVAPTDNERFSRITISVDVDSAPLEQVIKQLDKLINVVTISELAPASAVERELLLATLEVRPGQEGEITDLLRDTSGTVVDRGGDRVTVSLADHPDAVDVFENALRRYGIVELQRTGRIALPKLNPPAQTTTKAG